MYSKKLVAGLIVILFLSIVLITPVKLTAKSSGKIYSVSAVSVKRFKKSGSFLTVTTKGRFSIGNKKTKKKKVRFTIDRKCKWRYKNFGIRFPENKGVKKANYNMLRQYINNVRGLPENGYYTLSIQVKNKKIIRVDFQCL
ncbi:MAG: hypothetical protein IJI25_07475 [Eubacterium sp.]|nr:hypothetical protein [Eubacterium sp.]